MTDKLREEVRKYLKVKEIHGESKKDGIERYNCSEDISHNKTSLLENTHQTRKHERHSSTVPNIGQEVIDMKLTTSFVNKIENCHQNVSNQDIATSQLRRKKPDRKDILGNDTYNDKDVVTTPDRVEEEYKTVESVKFKSNSWEDSYDEREAERAKEYHQTDMQKMSTSKLLSTRSEVRQAFDGDSTFK